MLKEITSLILIISTVINTQICLAKPEPRLINSKINNVRVKYVEVNPKIHSVKFNIKSLNAITSLKNLRGNNQIAINGSFFKPDNGLTLGLFVREGELFTSPILNRVSFILDKNNNPRIEVPKLTGHVSFPQKSMDILYVNQPIFNPKGLTLLTSKYTVSIPKLNKYFKYVEVADNKVISISHNPIKPKGNNLILVGSRFPKIYVGDSLNINYGIPDCHNAISGGTYLVRNGQVYVDYTEQNFSKAFVSAKRVRTAVGINHKGNVILLTTSSKCNLFQLAEVMRSLRCVTSMNLDGGSSTQMLYKGSKYGSSRSVANAIVVGY